MTLSGAATPGQSRLGSDGHEGILRIPQSSSINGPLSSDSLVSYPGHSWRAGVSSLCRDAVSVFYRPSRLGTRKIKHRNREKGDDWSKGNFWEGKRWERKCWNKYSLPNYHPLKSHWYIFDVEYLFIAITPRSYLWVK